MIVLLGFIFQIFCLVCTFKYWLLIYPEGTKGNKIVRGIGYTIIGLVGATIIIGSLYITM